MLIQDVINKVAGQVPGCSEPEVISAYRYALIDFCTRSRVMTSWVTTTTDDLITPTITGDQQTVDILDALLDDKEITCASTINDRAVTEATDEEPVLTWTNPNVPQIVPQPATQLALQLLLVFAPGPLATVVEDSVWMRYGEALDHGTLARLFAEPGRPYSNPTLAGFHLERFERAITKAAAEQGARVKTNTRRLRAKANPF